MPFSPLCTTYSEKPNVLYRAMMMVAIRTGATAVTTPLCKHCQRPLRKLYKSDVHGGLPLDTLFRSNSQRRSAVHTAPTSLKTLLALLTNAVLILLKSLCRTLYLSTSAFSSMMIRQFLQWLWWLFFGSLINSPFYISSATFSSFHIFSTFLLSVNAVTLKAHSPVLFCGLYPHSL